jgi:mannose-6-phosphate isomerase
MQSDLNYPLLFAPIFMERLWGGRRLETVLGKRLPPDRRIGESWEISDHGAHYTIVANGPLRGKSLRELMTIEPEALLGPAAYRAIGSMGALCRFPLLVKWIDACEKLSIQVHPPDGHTRLPPGESGKTECWFIADAEPGAEIYVGLRRGIDRQALVRELSRGTVDRCLNVFPARNGDFYFVPAGTPHAIGAGVLLAEIQQTSDTTFRLSDWNRIDPTIGKPRALHVEAALDSIDFSGDSAPTQPRSAQDSPRPVEMLLGPEQCSQFVIVRRTIHSAESLGESDRFHILVCLSGNGQIQGEAYETPIARGDSLLLPARGPFACHPQPQLELLDAWIPA